MCKKKTNRQELIENCNKFDWVGIFFETKNSYDLL